MQGVYRGLFAGACIMAAAPATASGEAAASPFAKPASSFAKPTDHPMILDRSAAGRPAVHPMILAHPASPDVFGTVALNAGVTLYDARFRRVAAADARDPLIQRLAAGAAGLAPMQKIAVIQAEVAERVHWAHDLENIGVADYWDNAGDTLRRGLGDSEDIAIVKMQALKAAGFDPKDLYLSIGRHAQRGAHILLLVRTAAGFVVMDDQAAPVSAAQYSRFTPMLTIGEGMSWIHGRRISRMATASPAKPRAR